MIKLLFFNKLYFLIQLYNTKSIPGFVKNFTLLKIYSQITFPYLYNSTKLITEALDKTK